MGFFRNNVASRASMDRPNGYDRGIKRAVLSRYERLPREYRSRCYDDGIDRDLRGGPMAAAAKDGDLDCI